MQPVFFESPWIHPPEPEDLRQLFLCHGKRVRVDRGTALPHGGEAQAYVGLLERGLGAFTFEDRNGKRHIFALIVPGRLFGDLDAVTRKNLNLKGEVIRPSTVVLLERDLWEEELSRSVERMKLYARNAILKEESHMEGMIANFTLDLPTRLRLALRSVTAAYYTIKPGDWNPLPVKLTVAELGSMLAANRTSVNGILSDWMQKGLVRRDGRRIILHGSLLVRPDTPVEARPDNVDALSA